MKVRIFDFEGEFLWDVEIETPSSVLPNIFAYYSYGERVFVFNGVVTDDERYLVHEVMPTDIVI